MAERGEIEALINLLDDTDAEVVEHVTQQLVSYGTGILPVLSNLSADAQNENQQKQIEAIMRHINLSEVQDNLRQWAANGAHELFEGVYWIARYRQPDLDKEQLNQQIEDIKLDLWIELNNDLTPLEKIKKVNHIFYNVYHFRGDVEDYHSPENSFLQEVVTNRKGNPISLSILYAILCQRVGIPVYGVNLPQHYVLSFKDHDTFPDETSTKGYHYLEPTQEGKTLFYINSFNKGTVFSQWNIDQFLKQLNIDPSSTYYEPCSNMATIMRVCRNLIYAYENIGEPENSNDIGSLLATLEAYDPGW
jgi:hypothetical protein